MLGEEREGVSCKNEEEKIDRTDDENKDCWTSPFVPLDTSFQDR